VNKKSPCYAILERSVRAFRFLIVFSPKPEADNRLGYSYATKNGYMRYN
jgi:hypothetical protein